MLSTNQGHDDRSGAAETGFGYWVSRSSLIWLLVRAECVDHDPRAASDDGPSFSRDAGVIVGRLAPRRWCSREARNGDHGVRSIHSCENGSSCVTVREGARILVKAWGMVGYWALRGCLDRIADNCHLTTDPECRNHHPPVPGSRLDRASRGLECQLCMFGWAFSGDKRNAEQ